MMIRPRPVCVPEKPEPRIDLQDVLIVLGFIGLEVGVGMIYRPAALILGGLILLAFALLIETDKRRAGHVAAKERKS